VIESFEEGCPRPQLPFLRPCSSHSTSRSLLSLNVPLTLKGKPEESFGACALSLKLITRVDQLPALQIDAWEQSFDGSDRIGDKGFDGNFARRRFLPRPLWRAAVAMGGAFRIFCDELLGGATDFAARWRTQPTFELSLKLLRQWEASAAQLQPGNHYTPVDGFATLLGLEGLYTLQSPGPAHSCPSSLVDPWGLAWN
jgi:hypothetical protein